MSEKPRIAFVLQRALGWRSYAARLEEQVAARSDIAALVIPVERRRWAAVFDKRNNLGKADRWLRRRDPIDTFAGRAGAPIRHALHGFDAQAVHFAGHWPAGAMIGSAAPAMPFTCALDTTRAGIERSLPRDAWTPADMAREGQLLRSAAAVFPMSRWTAHSVIADCGVDAARVTVMPPALTLPAMAGQRTQEGRALQVVFIGNDVRRKGLARLADWISGPLAGQAVLHVISTDPEAEHWRGANGVTLHGRVDNARLVGELLPSMDVLCLPTFSDMSPQVLAEAAAVGLAAVASDLGGIPDLVVDGQTGLLVRPDDDAGFVAALSALARDRGRCAAMGAAARRLAEVSFDAQISFGRLIDRLVEIASDRHKAPQC